MVDDKSAYGKGPPTRWPRRWRPGRVPRCANRSPPARRTTRHRHQAPQAGVEVRAYGGYHTEVALILPRQAQAAGLQLTVMGGDTMTNSELVTAAGPAADNVMFTFSPDARKNPDAAPVVRRSSAPPRPSPKATCSTPTPRCSSSSRPPPRPRAPSTPTSRRRCAAAVQDRDRRSPRRQGRPEGAGLRGLSLAGAASTTTREVSASHPTRVFGAAIAAPVSKPRRPTRRQVAGDGSERRLPIQRLIEACAAFTGRGPERDPRHPHRHSRRHRGLCTPATDQRAHARRHVRPDRHRLHDGLRHHRHDQLRPWRHLHGERLIAVTAFTILAAADVTSIPLALTFVLIVSIFFTSAYGWAVERTAYRQSRLDLAGAAHFRDRHVDLPAEQRAAHPGRTRKADPPVLEGGIVLGEARASRCRIGGQMLIISHHGDPDERLHLDDRRPLRSPARCARTGLHHGRLLLGVS